MKNKELIACFLEKGVILDYNYIEDKKFYINDNLFSDFKENPYISLLYFGFEIKSKDMSQSLSFVHLICSTFIKALSQDTFIEFTREAPIIKEDEMTYLLNNIPFAVGSEFIDSDWITSFWNALSIAFNIEIKKYKGLVSEFLKEHSPNINTMGRVCFHLVENKHDNSPFAFLATYSISKDEKENHVPLKNALIEYKDKNDLLLKLLSTVSKAADKSNFISELVENGEIFSPLKFSTDEAYTFLKEIPIYEESGVLCRIPNWWKKSGNSLRLSISIGNNQPSKLGMDALLNFDPAIYLGEEKITREEIEKLLAQTNGLSFIKGKWVEVDHEKLNLLLNAYEKANELSEIEELTMSDALRMELDPNEILNLGEDKLDIEVSNGDWLKSVKERLSDFKETENINLGEDFKAILRQYQKVGFNWLYTMKNYGFGALLADDMGLGKTVQIIALLEYLRENGDFKALLVIPASLIGNWKNEINKFAPKIKYSVLHSNKKEIHFDEANLFITTYGMVTRIQELKDFNWNIVIIDEAQAIKNPSTKQTKAVKEIKGSFKIAMTGTPIENRLSDLWSLFDFLNKGLLGTPKEFSTLAKKLQEEGNYSKLKDVVNPFIMRRLKTDKSIISDLPEKLEIKAFTTLTKKQIVLYKSLVKEISDKITNSEGIERKGLILSSIIKFKQICNHPDQYLGLSEYEPKHSSKFDKLQEICETIYEKREKVLVFTQFKEITEYIALYLESIFGRSGLVLHGGTSVKKRSELVDLFNSNEYIPFMVLSLKAGGVGLNLTAANHVVHFDRWWNPAVENQATDRAFRIGQKKNVIIHKMITTGTIEEKIDSIIEEKSKLSDDIIATSGENWITEMSNDELIDLFKLV